MSPNDWFRDAKCKELSFEEADRIFFPSKGQHKVVREAKAICRECPVQPDCLEYNLTNISINDDIGVWAGTTRNERRRIRKARRIRKLNDRS